MIRRRFLTTGLAALPALPTAARSQTNSPKFKLKYAPHPGMFKNSAGEDILDQI